MVESSVEFAHFTFTLRAPIVPMLTLRAVAGPFSYVDFTSTSEGAEGLPATMRWRNGTGLHESPAMCACATSAVLG
jgi:hypothetical protein